MKNFKKVIFTILPLLALTLLFSCKKDDPETPAGTEGKNFKFTVTVNGVEDQDYVSFVFVGATLDNAKTIWKVNGVTKSNETAISLGKNDFIGATKTYIIESTTPLRLVTTSQQCLNPGATNPSYKVSFKAEVDGEVVTNDQNFNVTYTTDYTHKYDY
ncbi:hypothetical protein [Pedobacter psychrodurus]|uniref:hypothetical protein n=1 Tax=Pedobacter psychrodurus TaxID=2530456 RepID=UPI00292FAD70|nr:hypothetical protein [Pedobacter psychrodurus]